MVWEYVVGSEIYLPVSSCLIISCQHIPTTVLQLFLTPYIWHIDWLCLNAEYKYYQEHSRERDAAGSTSLELKILVKQFILVHPWNGKKKILNVQIRSSLALMSLIGENYNKFILSYHWGFWKNKEWIRNQDHSSHVNT